MPNREGDLSEEEATFIASFIRSKSDCKHERLAVHDKISSFELPTPRLSPSRGKEKGFSFILVRCYDCGLLQAYDAHFLQVHLDHQKKR